MHLRRLAEQHVHGQIDRELGFGIRDWGLVRSSIGCRQCAVANPESRISNPVIEDAIPHHQPLLGCRHADRGERAAFAGANGGEFFKARLRHAEHIAFLRFVAPQFQRRQRRIVGKYAAQVDDAAHARIVQQLGDGVGQTTRAHVVEPADRVVHAQRHAAVDDLLAATFHFWVFALHAGEIQRFGAVAGRHRTGRTAAQADQHRRAAEHDHRIARLQAQLFHLVAIDRAQATGQHDRLVVRAGQARAFGKLEAAEIAEQVRSAEFVVERCAAERAVEHDVQRRRHARV
ncbi:multidrug resistance transport transmembrane protein [Xanthomonas citri pv. aurantifolii str. ICPB 11122]|nr:multidrug resistance transport transmembrane protein [Xanthomonas citri pv. aurantifolii str. ICPB 11122]